MQLCSITWFCVTFICNAYWYFLIECHQSGIIVHNQRLVNGNIIIDCILAD